MNLCLLHCYGNLIPGILTNRQVQIEVERTAAEVEKLSVDMEHSSVEFERVTRQEFQDSELLQESAGKLVLQREAVDDVRGMCACCVYVYRDIVMLLTGAWLLPEY